MPKKMVVKSAKMAPIKTRQNCVSQSLKFGVKRAFLKKIYIVIKSFCTILAITGLDYDKMTVFCTVCVLREEFGGNLVSRLNPHLDGMLR